MVGSCQDDKVKSSLPTITIYILNTYIINVKMIRRATLSLNGAKRRGRRDMRAMSYPMGGAINEKAI